MVRKALFVTTASDFMGTSSDGVAASSTNTYYSKPILGPDGFGLTVRTTGTLTGTWTLWRTNKEGAVLTTDADWDQETTFAPTNPAAGVSSWAVEVNGSRSAIWRLKYVNASGTGSIFAYSTSEEK